MSNDASTADIRDQYTRALGMFRDAVNLCPAEEWKKGDLPCFRPAGVAYHVIECVDFYTSDLRPDKFPWGSRFGIDWETEDTEKLPDREQILSYLDDMETRLDQWFESNDLSAEETVYRWTGKTRMGLAAYGIRHAQHHAAEMALELTRRSCKSPDWR